MTENTIEVKPLPPVGDMDAVKWAESFVAHVLAYPGIPTDEGAMIGWFANAIMAGYDTAIRKHDSLVAERDTLKAAIELAQQDIRDWVKTARGLRGMDPDPDHSVKVPSLRGIEESEQVLYRLHAALAASLPPQEKP